MCKNEFSNQGILDVLFCIIEMLYYKTTPPCLFEKVFKANNLDQKEKDQTDLKSFKPTESVGQSIIREETTSMMIKILGIILQIVDEH